MATWKRLTQAIPRNRLRHSTGDPASDPTETVPELVNKPQAIEIV
jgi:hypothetical protein